MPCGVWVNCSPFLLNATLQYHLDGYGEIDPELVKRMKNSFYVDDLASADQTVGDVFELYKKARLRVGEGGFKLRKWLTNI